MLQRGDFPWINPFNRSEISQFTSACKVQKNFTANEFLLDDLPDQPPKGLWPYCEAMKKLFDGRQYSGSWDGYEPIGIDRKILEMNYTDLPIRVREWVEELGRRETQDASLPIVAVFKRSQQIHPEAVWKKETTTVKPQSSCDLSEIGRDTLDNMKVITFAPGAIYPVLPLWVAEGSSCESTLLDTTRYSHELMDGGVIAWITKHTIARRAKGKRDVVFTIEAQVLKRLHDRKAQGSREMDEL
ncbi:hypothetical protein F5X99DRAFT_422846 [Biscogniauxia marginata]|nr:hypothetical protein F5X99DRAFT_422846 [Biscogniauxia marginata]